MSTSAPQFRPFTRRETPWLIAALAGVCAAAINLGGVEEFGSVEIIFGGWLVLLVAYSHGPGPALLAALLGFSTTWWRWGHPWCLVLGGLEAVAVGLATQRLRLGRLSAIALFWIAVGLPTAAAVFLWLDPLPFPSNWATILRLPLNSIIMAMLTLPLLDAPPIRALFPQPGQAESDEALDQILAKRLAAIIGLAITVLTVFIGSSRDYTLRRDAEADLAADARELRRDLGEILVNHRRAIAAILPASGEALPVPVLQERLERTLAEFPGFLTMLGADRRGAIIAAAPLRGPDGRIIAHSGVNISDRSYFREAMASGRPFLSEVFRGRGFGDDLIAALSVPKPGADGRPELLIAGSLNLRQILSALITGESTAGRSVLVVDGEGRVVVSSGPMSRPVLSVLDGPLLRKPVGDEVLAFDEKTARGTETFLVAHAVLREVGWHVYLAEPVWTSQSIIAVFYLVTTIAATLAILVAVLLARTTAQNLTGSLGETVRSIDRLARGELDQLPAPHPQVSRELTVLNLAAHRAATTLSRANRELASALAQRDKTHQQLRQLLFNLDEKVRQRTEELEVALQQAESANRAKSEFIAATSHELRTPLNVILGMCEVLLEEHIGPLTSGQRESIQAVDESGRHLLSLINDILDLSKIEAGKLTLDFREFALRDLCEASLRFVRDAAAKKQQKLDFDLCTQVSSLTADPLRLKQVLVNLLSNAVKFTPESGRITLRVELVGDGTELRFSVIDTGIGIAAADIKRLFQPFQQVDAALNRKHSGTGLGLALVRRLTEMHSGRVSLESTPGVGSTFSVQLPLLTTAPVHPPALPPPPSAPPPVPPAALPPQSPLAPSQTTGLQVLIAEDNDSNALIYRRSPALEGALITRARNGLEAVSLATANPPALILMDVQMPELDGLEATRRLREDPRTQHVPIIVITALAMYEDRVRALEAGASAYLSKPFSIRDLGRTISEVLAANRKPS